jgi:hypothetical protein
MPSAQALLSLGKKVLLSLWGQGSQPIRRPSQLRGEELESRCVPANTYLWDPTNGFNWKTPNNWLILNPDQRWVPTALIPGLGDHVVFRSSYVDDGQTWDSNDDCVVDAGANPILIQSIKIIGN